MREWRQGKFQYGLQIWLSLLLYFGCPVIALEDRCLGCARALMIVAHPDDEVLFGGELLLGQVAALPRNCRHACWHVICATNGNVPRRKYDFTQAMLAARSRGLAAEISMEIWNYEDCNRPDCESFGGGEPLIQDKIRRVLDSEGPWDYVVTHNEHGEYYHAQHVGLHKIVKSLTTEGRHTQGRPQMYVFNPVPEVNVSLSSGKQRLLYYYLVNEQDNPYRSLTFKSLSTFSEHIIPVEDFLRPALLRLSYFHGLTDVHESLHFAYAWVLAHPNNLGDIGAFTAPVAISWVIDFLQSSLDSTICNNKDSRSTSYPSLCNNIQHALANRKDFGLAQLLEHMESVATPSLASPSSTSSDSSVGSAAIAKASAPDCSSCCHGDGESCVTDDASCREHCVLPQGGSLKCLDLAPIDRFGTVRGFTASGGRGGYEWVELLVARPILVGWRQGYKGHTFRILGSTGPLRLDLAAASSYAKMPHSGSSFAVQPNDVVGWGVYAASEHGPFSRHVGIIDEPALSKNVSCIESCDGSGLCVFKKPDSAASPNSQAVSRLMPTITLDLIPRTSKISHDIRGLFQVRDSLNISEYVEPTSTYEELLTLRQRLEHPDLSLFEDKIRLRRELLNVIGVAATPSIHLSNSDFEVIRHIQNRQGYVVKPSHMSESQNVFVVLNDMNLLQQAWGFPKDACRVSLPNIQETVYTFAKTTALDWECRALVGVQPGVIVEDLVLAFDEYSNQVLVDEYKFYVVWGEVVFGEKVPFSSGAAMEISRDGDVLMTKSTCPPMCVPPCYKKMVREAEHVARSARTDYLRVDFLIYDRCEAVYVSEVELFPASDFSQHLKEVVAEKWRYGYGV